MTMKGSKKCKRDGTRAQEPWSEQKKIFSERTNTWQLKYYTLAFDVYLRIRWSISRTPRSLSARVTFYTRELARIRFTWCSISFSFAATAAFHFNFLCRFELKPDISPDMLLSASICCRYTLQSLRNAMRVKYSHEHWTRQKEDKRMMKRTGAVKCI